MFAFAKALEFLGYAGLNLQFEGFGARGVGLGVVLEGVDDIRGELDRCGTTVEESVSLLVASMYVKSSIHNIHPS